MFACLAIRPRELEGCALRPVPRARCHPRLAIGSYDAQFPEGFDPNYFPGDVRTFAGAFAAATATAEAVAPSVEDDELEALLRTFDFDRSTDEEVQHIEDVVFRDLQKEAAELTASWLTQGLVQRVLLMQASLPEALAALLSGKLHAELPGALKYSQVGGSRAESATAEEALRSTMSGVFGEAAVRRAVVSDLIKVLVVDPAADGLLQPFLFFKGFHALSTHRVAHSLWRDGTAASRGAALMLQSRVAELFALDLHPAAQIGNGVMFDHATGIVIGSTAIVGSDVYMLHGVTLGATGKPTGGKKRHPTIGSRVVLGAGSTVLGDISVGDGCTVGAAAIVTRDVPDGATVIGVNKVVERKDVPAEEKSTADDYTWFWSV
jgi:serine O-acetyltransferase